MTVGDRPAPARPRPPGGAGPGQPGPRRRRADVPDLAIVVGFAPGRACGAARCCAAGVPHLAVAADEAIGVVGPLVRPGQTACLRCLDLTRAGLDPAWPLILAQVTGRAAQPTACDAALAAAVAAQAAGQALAFLDRAQAVHPAENGTLELVLPGWQWRRRTLAAVSRLRLPPAPGRVSGPPATAASTRPRAISLRPVRRRHSSSDGRTRPRRGACPGPSASRVLAGRVPGSQGGIGPARFLRGGQ